MKAKQKMKVAVIVVVAIAIVLGALLIAYFICKSRANFRGNITFSDLHQKIYFKIEI